MRFGYDVDHDIGYGRNSDKLSEECGDLQAVMDELPLNTALKEQSQYDKIAKAERAKATITEVEGSHVIMISQPQAVADVIMTAVNAVS